MEQLDLIKLITNIDTEVSFGFVTDEIENTLFHGNIEIDTMISKHADGGGYIYNKNINNIVPLTYNKPADLVYLVPKPYLLSHFEILHDKRHYHYNENPLFTNYGLQDCFPILTEKDVEKYRLKFQSIITNKIPFSLNVPFRQYLDNENKLKMITGEILVIDDVIIKYFYKLHKYIFDKF